MKAPMTTLAVIATLVIFLTPATAQDNTPLSGTWTFSIELPSGVVSAQANITVEDAALRGTISAPNGQLSIFGNWDSASVRIYVSTADNEILFVFEGARGSGTMSGTLASGGELVGKWSATRN